MTSYSIQTRCPFQHDLFIAPGNEDLAVQIHEVSSRGHHTPHVLLGKERKEILTPSPELRHRCKTSSIPSAYGIRVITNTNGRLGRDKLRTHHRGSPPRVPPITARIRRAIITTSALCRKHQQGRSPRGTTQPSRFYDAHDT
jgi:hypothetical protein